MNYKLFILFFLLAQTTGTLASTNHAGPKCTGVVQISGCSNFGEFTFKLDLSDSFLRTTNNLERETESSRFFLFLPVNDFEGKTYQMKKDFLELLQARQHPEIRIAFEEFRTDGNGKASEPVITEITIAGIAKMYSFNCRIDTESEEGFYIEGSKQLSIKDFNLIPPKRLFGLMKIDDIIHIHFSINFT